MAILQLLFCHKKDNGNSGATLRISVYMYAEVVTVHIALFILIITGACFCNESSPYNMT